MRFANIKALAARLSIATVAAGTLFLAGTAPAHAQQWGLAVQYRAPAYVVDRDGFRDRDRRDFYERSRREFFERQRREEFLRHQAWLREQQRERFYDRDHDRDYGRTYGYW